MQASIPSTRKSHSQAEPAWLTHQVLLGTAVLLLVAALCVPVLTAQRSALNSDQSLYLAEALNIARGEGPVYPNGEPIVHRAPLYPALIAAAFNVESPSLEAAYVVPQLSILANVLLLFLLGRALFGPWGGAAAAITAAASPYLRGLGTTLFLDSTQVTFLLASLLIYHHADRNRSLPLTALAGALLGASFLVKEASALFLPLPLAVALLYGFARDWKQLLAAWFAGFATATAWWWVWVYVHTGGLFLVGPADGTLALTLAAAGGAGAIALIALLRFAPPHFAANRATRIGALLLLLAWGALFFGGLEATGWQYESNYLSNLASYMSGIFLPNVQPAALVLLACVWLALSAVKSREAGVVLVCALLYASFFVLVADRGLSLRDQLPVVYLAYLAVGGCAAWLVKMGAGFDFGPRLRALGGAGAIGVAVTLSAIVLLSGTSLSQARPVALQDDWDNRLAHETAAWLSANLEPGAVIMSSRLYYSHLHFLTGGAFQIHQLPTVEVRLNTAPDAALPLSRSSTLFRWENHLMPQDTLEERWLYLTRYPVKGYFIALAEEDLLDGLQQRGVDYMVITTLDAGFSSPSFNRYLEDNPAFELLHVITASPDDEARVYRVHRDALAPKAMPVQVTHAAFDYVVLRAGGEAQALEYLERLNPAGFGLTAR